MTEEEIKKLVELQRSYFYTGATRPVKTRIEHLKKLKDWVTAHEEDINKALGEDLGKSSFESYMCETGLILNELTHMIRNVDEYAEEQEMCIRDSHRIAMSFAVAGTICDGTVDILNGECVNISYPEFYHDLYSLDSSRQK